MFLPRAHATPAHSREPACPLAHFCGMTRIEHIAAMVAVALVAIAAVAWLSPKAVASVEIIQAAYEKNGPGMDRSGHCADVVWPHVPARCLDADAAAPVRFVDAPDMARREAPVFKEERVDLRIAARIAMSHDATR